VQQRVSALGQKRTSATQSPRWLARAATLCSVDGSRDRFEIILGELHHQLPDAPPPPDEPPPPEKPPPKPPPPIPAPQPDPHDGPPYGMIMVRPLCLTERRRKSAPLALPMRYQIMKIISRGNREANSSLMAFSSETNHANRFGQAQKKDRRVQI
jgi:hypothetical protein